MHRFADTLPDPRPRRPRPASIRPLPPQPSAGAFERLGIPNDGAPVVASWGAGVDSTAMLVAMKHRGIIPDAILFADTGGEKPETYDYIDEIAPWLEHWGAPPVTCVRKLPSPRVSYTTLEGNCLANETLPSLAFGRHSCSLKWKGDVLDQTLVGVARGPNARPGWRPALDAWARGQKVIKLIGYDSGRADQRRRRRIPSEDARYRYVFPLQVLGWTRPECIEAIAGEGLPVPLKSACFFCPASKTWELWWLAGAHPSLFLRALEIERNALEGRHSRFDEVKFGASWRSYIQGGKRFPSEAQAGLGRRFSWNQFAIDNGIVDHEGRFIGNRGLCLAKAEQLRGDDNALDGRAPCDRRSGELPSETRTRASIAV